MLSDPLLGRVIDDKYRIEAEIGTGGMATIYRATRLKIGDVVAIKILHGELLREPKFAERFQREAQAAARLKHPNVVTVHDFGVSDDGIIYLVMELVEGRNLRTMIKDDGPMPTAMAAEIIRQVCAALTEAHRQNTIHRDIKPANIAVTPSDDGLRVKVLDFGIASLRGGTTMTFTQTGTVLGTPAYMSPEQCLGEDLDGRSDIYSVGIVLFEMLCGVVPFNSPTATAVVMQHVQQAPPPLRVLNVSVSPAVEAVVLRALAKRREDRQQSAKQLADELSAAVAGTGAPLYPDARSFTAEGFSPNHAAMTMVQTPFVPAQAAHAPAGRGRTSGIVIGLAAALVLAATAFGAQRLFFATAPSHGATHAKPSTAHRSNRRPPVAAVDPGAAVPPQAALPASNRYVATTCGAIADSRTGLMWLVGPDTNFTWDAAEAWIASASACGGSWGMPSIRQLAALYDPQRSAGIGYYTRGAHYPAHIDPIFAAIGSGSWVWSREAYPGGTARSFNFNQGLPVVYARSDTTLATRVFAVRSGSPPARTSRVAPPASAYAPPRAYPPPRYAVRAAPSEAVRQYYNRLNAFDYAGAYALLSPDFQRHMPFERWRSGYATTIASVANVEDSNDPSRVPLRLVARDRNLGSVVTTVYEGAWSLVADGRGGWLLDDGRLHRVSTQ
jgi:tRNA A-37 threonylcarbamoyl transferase component Bud32